MGLTGSPVEPASEPPAALWAGIRPLDERQLLRHHGPFVAVLVAGAVVRILVSLAVQPALEFVQDSFGYLWDAAHPAHRDVVHPSGYGVFLRVLGWSSHDLRVVPGVQHLLGVGIGIGTYFLVRRIGAGKWAGAVAAAPILLSGYQIDLEQFVLSDCLFEALLFASIAVLVWPSRPRPLTALASGLLLGAAIDTRTVGMAAIPVVVAYAALRSRQWRPAAAVLGGAAMLVVAYAGWFDAGTGHFGLDAYDGYFLAGRVEPFANCHGAHLTAAESRLCPTIPTSQRENPDWWVWDPDSPLRRPQAPAGENRNAVAQAYAEKIVLHQPFTYAWSVASYTASYFFSITPRAVTAYHRDTWVLPTGVPSVAWKPEIPPSDPYVWEWTWPGSSAVIQNRMVATHGFGEARVTPHVWSAAVTWLNRYVRFVVLPGPFLLLALAATAWAFAGSRARSSRHPHNEHSRWAALGLAVTGTIVLLATAATAGQDPRYLLPVEMLIWPAGVIGASVLLRTSPLGAHGPRPGRPPGRPPVS